MRSARDDTDYDFAIALNYGFTAGSPQILRFMTEHVEIVHSPTYSDWECCATYGTLFALEVALCILCNPGETALIESHAYSGTLACARAIGVHLQSVKLDDNGLIPEDHDHILTTWDLSKGQKPYVLYTTPTGQNPTGMTQPLERHPYYFIQYNDIPSRTNELDGYLSILRTYYLSLDVSGHVHKMNSTSKILATGLRAG
ncbi:Aromatic/aminoadipate aminotransferase 1 [Fusarium odoratissimum]